MMMCLPAWTQADHIEESVAYELLELMDLNGDGVIDFPEFCKGWKQYQTAYDSNSTG
eukprot:COSAG06_NODE_2773_length_6304_cov_2.463820_5_plen_57_part_00